METILTLEQLYWKYKVGDWPDKGSVHSYIEVYETLLAPYRMTAKNVLEVGLMSGESLRMWDEYFTEATIHGVDCSETPLNGVADLRPLIAEIENEYTPKIQVQIFNAEDEKEFSNRFNGMKFDVIIEDANHDIEQQLNIFVTLNPYLNRGGIYIIEDIQDIDKHSYIFKSDPGWQVLDRRHIKNRYDDVIAIYRK